MNQGSNKPRALIALGSALTLTMLLSLAVTPLGAFALTEHCPDHNGHPGKVNSGSAGDDVVLPAGTILCVKAGDHATGVEIADGSTTLKEYVEAAGITVGNDQVPDVSYYIVYQSEPSEPAATGEPSDDPSSDPSSEPSEPAATGEPSEPAATGEPSDDPSSDPSSEPSEPAATGEPSDDPAEPSPAMTPPPTSTLRGGNDGGSLVLVLLAGVAAAAWLFLRPMSRARPAARRR